MRTNFSRLFSLFILIGFLTLAQPIPYKKGIFAECHPVPDSGKIFIDLSYRIKYSSLIYLKDSRSYFAKFALSVERSDTNGNFIDRNYFVRNLKYSSIDKANSDDFIQGIVKLNYSGKKERVVFSVVDLNADREIKRFHFIIDSINANIIAGESFTGKFVTELTCTLANYDGVIPFSSLDYDLVLLSSYPPDSVSYLKLNNADSTYTLLVSSVIRGNIIVDSADNEITLSIKPDSLSKYYIYCFRQINNKIFPGYYSASFVADDTTKTISLPPICQVWLDKPRSLEKPDYAYRIMNRIDTSLQSSPYYMQNKKDFIFELLQFWKKYQTDSGHTFNDHTKEFFKRVDYANEKFNSIKGSDGAETDRGEMYIRLGAPDTTERITTRSGKIGEVWIYKRINRNFVFIDVSGNGNFELSDK